MDGNQPRYDDKYELTVLKGAVENANEAFVTIDDTHEIVFFNHAAEAILGYGAEEVIGRDLNAILGPTCPPNHRQAVDRYVRTRTPKLIGHETELTVTRKNGQTFPAMISFSVAQVLDRLFFTATIRDLTEKKAMEEKILRSERLAALGQIVAEITHEIKNPLMLIGGFTGQLMKKLSAEKDVEKLRVIQEEVRRLEGLIKELNDLYLPHGFSHEPVDLNELLNETSGLAEDLCQQRNIDLHMDLGPGPILVRGDRDKLKQVFINLMRNGIEAMDSQGTLSVKSGTYGDMAEVTIIDTGPGISEDAAGSLFDPFFTTKKYGTGLGLPVSRRIVEEGHRGSLTLTNNRGQGTTARVTIPALGTEEEEK